MMISVINEDGKILSFSKNDGEVYIDYKVDNDIKNKIGINFYHLLQDINSKVFNRKK